MNAPAYLNDTEVAQLRAIQERLQPLRPGGRGRDALMHDAVYDGISAVIATGQGIMSSSMTFKSASDSVRKAVMKS